MPYSRRTPAFRCAFPSDLYVCFPICTGSLSWGSGRNRFFACFILWSTLFRWSFAFLCAPALRLTFALCQSFQRVAYSAARACFPMCALVFGVDLWWSRSVIAYFWARLFSGRLSLIKIRSRLILELSEWSLFRGAHLLAGMYVCFGGCLSPLIGSHLVITRFMVSVRYPLCKFGFMIGICPL